MRQLLTACLFLVCVCSLAYCQSGTCAVDIQGTVGTCGNSAGCSDVYPITWPGDACDFTGSCEYFVNTTTSCCGIQGYSYLTDSGTTCEWAKFKDPKMRQDLIELAKTENILIPDCRGAYVPAGSVLARL